MMISLFEGYICKQVYEYTQFYKYVQSMMHTYVIKVNIKIVKYK